MAKKKKLKLKRNIGIGIGIIFLVFVTIFVIKLQVESTKLSKKDLNVEPTEEELKLERLGPEVKELKYLNKKNLDRYLAYQEKNPDLKTEQIVKNVNMNLDRPWYENPIPAKNLNTNKILVNKYFFVTEKYIPENLVDMKASYGLDGMKMVKEANDAFERMSDAARKENYRIIAMSTYRDYQYQANLYNRYVESDGKEKADTYSARPGFSEHQTGLAADIYNGVTPYTEFETTGEYQWMQDHAHEYGFIIRFPKGKESETGYQFESWHYRYVGIDAANYIKKNNITLEEYVATILREW